MNMEVQCKFQEGGRVRIKDNIDPFNYGGMTTIGNEGTIAAIQEDRFGLPQVFIQWDKNHWTYNGAPDGWTFEDHFDIVESTMTEPSKQELAKQLGQQFVEGLTNLFAETEDKPSQQGEQKQEFE